MTKSAAGASPEEGPEPAASSGAGGAGDAVPFGLLGGLRPPKAVAPLLAALVVLVSALPALFLMPPLDRDESRFAQASAQMLESGDFVDIRYQSEPRDKKPVGIHWLQAASVRLFSSVEARAIWAYRLPSLLGAMAAAAACAWGAQAFFGARGGLFAGVVLGASFLLTTEAFIAKTDAVLCGATALSMAALGRIYGASRGGPAAGRWVKALFWIGQGVGLLDKGPITPMVAGLALLALWIVDRKAGWMRGLGWGWGLIGILALVGPWAAAITVATDGSFWTGAIGGDLAPKLVGGHETHGAPFGLHALLLPLLFFPAAALLPSAGVAAVRGRSEAGVRFALAWLLPSWFVFELMPTKLVHYTLPLYGAAAWLAAAALTRPDLRAFGPRARLAGALLSGLVGLVFTIGVFVLLNRYPSPGLMPLALLSAATLAAAGLAPAALLLLRGPWPAAAAAVGLGVLAHVTLTGALAPEVGAFWTSARAARSLKSHGLDPRNGVVPGPVAVAGYAEPSLVFALGTATELDSPQDAAESLRDGQPALVEARVEPEFLRALGSEGVAARKVDEIRGLDYSTGKPVSLGLWRRLDGAAPEPTREEDAP